MFIGVENEAENDDVDCCYLGEDRMTEDQIKKEVEEDDDELLGLEFTKSGNGKLRVRTSGMRKGTDNQ